MNTKTSEFTHLKKLSILLILTQLGQVVVAVALANNIFVLIMLFGMGITPIVGQLNGANNYTSMEIFFPMLSLLRLENSAHLCKVHHHNDVSSLLYIHNIPSSDYSFFHDLPRCACHYFKANIPTSLLSNT